LEKENKEGTVDLTTRSPSKIGNLGKSIKENHGRQRDVTIQRAKKILSLGRASCSSIRRHFKRLIKKKNRLWMRSS